MKQSIVFILLFLLVTSCRENTLISSRLSPANDTARVKADTLYTCVTHTFFENDNYTSTNLNGIPVYHAVGSLVDSFFGSMTAASNFQISNPIPGSVLDTSYHIDSFELVLPYGAFSYGDTLNHAATATYQVFYLGDTLGYFSSYYSFTDKAVDMGAPFSAPVSVNLYHLQDSVTILGTARTPALHIKLNYNAVYAKLAHAMAVSASTLTSDPANAFIAAFNGICVRPADYRKFSSVVPYFRLDPLGTDAYSQAGIIMYYRNPTQGLDTESAMVFPYNQAGCANFNSMTKSYGRYPVNNLLHSTQANDSVVALSNTPGESIDIKIGGLTHIGGYSNFLQNHIVNQAQLQISLINSPLNFGDFAIPTQLYPVGIGNGTYPAGITAGLTYEVQDRFPETSLTPYYILDGTSHVVTYDNSTNISVYNIGLPREVIANIAANNDTLHLHLHGTQVFYGAYRMLAGGGNYPNYRYKAKLIVVHSSLKN